MQVSPSGGFIVWLRSRCLSSCLSPDSLPVVDPRWVLLVLGCVPCHIVKDDLPSPWAHFFLARKPRAQLVGAWTWSLEGAWRPSASVGIECPRRASHPASCAEVPMLSADQKKPLALVKMKRDSLKPGSEEVERPASLQCPSHAARNSSGRGTVKQQTHSVPTLPGLEPLLPCPQGCTWT